MKEAQIVEKIRAQEGISYKDALKVFHLQRPENNHGSHAISTKTSNRYMPQSALSSAASSEPKTWAQKVKSQYKQTVQTVNTETQTQDDLTPSTLQGITVNKFIELMCKIISLCKSSDNLDIAKTVTDLTKKLYSVTTLSLLTLMLPLVQVLLLHLISAPEWSRSLR
jgi:hypothetical protein